MNYYEELGIAPNAGEEEIRRAHRRLTKLLHPDQHTDEGIKQLADVQMRRLNSIVAVLLDPESRREYDEQLRDGEAGYSGIRPAGAKRRRRRASWPWWVASTAAAIVLTLVVVWFWAGNFGSSFFGTHAPTYIPPDSRDAPASAAEVAQPSTRPPASGNNDPAKQANTAPAPTSPVPADAPSVVRALPSQTVTKVPSPANNVAEPSQEAADTHRNSPAHRNLVLPKSNMAALVHPEAPHVELPPPPGLAIANPSRIEGSTLPVANLPAVPPRPPMETAPTKTVSYSAAAKTVPADPLEGEWIYAPTAPEKKKPGFYPPEYIDLKLFRDEGHLRGQYRARYRVADRPISPDVEFALSSDSDEHKFTWKAPNGTQGTLKISAIDPNVIRIEWRTTVFSRQPALTAGTATLVKRTQ